MSQAASNDQRVNLLHMQASIQRDAEAYITAYINFV